MTPLEEIEGLRVKLLSYGLGKDEQDKVILDIAALMLSKKENKDHWIEVQKIILNI